MYDIYKTNVGTFFIRTPHPNLIVRGRIWVRFKMGLIKFRVWVRFRQLGLRMGLGLEWY